MKTSNSMLCASLFLMSLASAEAEDAAVAGKEGVLALPAEITPAKLPPGCLLKVRYNWDASGPMNYGNQVFTHLIGPKGVGLTENHHPVPATNSELWKGKISYVLPIKVPETFVDGEYTVAIGFYPAGEGKDKDFSEIKSLRPGAGVKPVAWAKDWMQVGSFTVDKNAPLPPRDTEGAKTLDLTGYKETFVEDFDKLDVSAWGPGTRWIAHTPWNGDFGDAAFLDPSEEDPFTVKDGVLRIEARRNEKLGDKWGRKWQSGCLASNDNAGQGFSQVYGYFEARMKLPAGPGVWPAFWLASSPPPAEDPKQENSWDNWMARFDAARTGCIEIDVIEYYGHETDAYCSVVHAWRPEPHRAEATKIYTKPNECIEGFHNYGVMVEPEWTTMYFDGIAVWKAHTPPEHKRPLMILLNLALGSGWPIEQTPSPSYMYVDYVKAYKKDGG